MHDLDDSGATTGTLPAPAFHVRDGAARRALADRITEDVLQLLFTAHQDLAEVRHHGPVLEADLLQSAQECTLGAISILRVVAEAVREPAAGPAADGGEWERTASVIFDAMTDAWIVTCEFDDLLFASETACRLLDRTPAELSALVHDQAGWPQSLARLPHAAASDGVAHFDLDVPLKDGAVRPIRVQSHALPLVQGVRRSYISLLTPRTPADEGAPAG